MLSDFWKMDKQHAFADDLHAFHVLTALAFAGKSLSHI